MKPINFYVATLCWNKKKKKKCVANARKWRCIFHLIWGVPLLSTPKKPKIRKKEPLYFIVDEFNVYHKMLNEFAVVVCSHFGWVCCCCLQAESAHINCNKKNSAFCFVHHQPRRRRFKIQDKDNHGNHRNEFRSFSL